MKYFAILKDSFREAIDTKVFYVMVGMSLFLTLLTATLSFKPQSPENLMKVLVVPLYVDDMTDMRPERLMHLAMEPDFRRYEVVRSEPQEGHPEGPDSPYRISLVAHCKTAAEADKLRELPGPVLERISQRFGVLDELKLADVKEARIAPAGAAGLPEKPPATDVYFDVTVQPTPVARRLWPHEPS